MRLLFAHAETAWRFFKDAADRHRKRLLEQHLTATERDVVFQLATKAAKEAVRCLACFAVCVVYAVAVSHRYTDLKEQRLDLLQHAAPSGCDVRELKWGAQKEERGECDMFHADIASQVHPSRSDVAIILLAYALPYPVFWCTLELTAHAWWFVIFFSTYTLWHVSRRLEQEWRDTHQVEWDGYAAMWLRL
jgi:hypothetical protein